MGEPSAAETFNAITMDCGGRLDTASQHPIAAQILEYHRERIETWVASVKRNNLPRIVDIHFDYVANLELNAFALVDSGRGFIGVNVGTMVLIYRMFRRMLAHSDILSHIGNAEAEARNISTPDPLEADATYIAFSNESFVPQDPTRKHYAELLAEMAIDFAIAHEHGHIANGHVYYEFDTVGRSYIAEQGLDSPAVGGNITSQTLEMDADCYAVQRGLAKLLGRRRDIDKLPEQWRPFYEDVSEAIFTWLLSAYTFFRIFGSHPIDFSQLESLEHPPPAMRLLMSTSTAHEILRKQREENLLAALMKAVPEVFRQVETAFALIKGQPINFDGLRDACGPEGNAHTFRLLESWKVIRPKLEPFAVTRLAP